MTLRRLTLGRIVPLLEEVNQAETRPLRMVKKAEDYFGDLIVADFNAVALRRKGVARASLLAYLKIAEFDDYAVDEANTLDELKIDARAKCLAIVSKIGVEELQRSRDDDDLFYLYRKLIESDYSDDGSTGGDSIQVAHHAVAHEYEHHLNRHVCLRSRLELAELIHFLEATGHGDVHRAFRRYLRARENDGSYPYGPLSRRHLALVRVLYREEE